MKSYLYNAGALSTMLIRRRTPISSPMALPPRRNVSAGKTKQSKVIQGFWTVLFPVFLFVTFFSSIQFIFRNIQFDTTTQHSRRRRRIPRVIFMSTPFQSNTTTTRSVPHTGNRTAQHLIRRADNLHLIQVETGNCRLRFPWQKTQRPNCNALHELADPNRRIMGFGYWRDVWRTNSGGIGVVYKSMRYEHDFTHRNLDRMRRDANVMERMTGSPFIIDLYAFCGTSSLSELGDGGDIIDALEPPEEKEDAKAMGQLDKLRAATQAAIALADLHNIDMEGEPSIAHTDITPGQFIKVGDRCKLNDFNRARFLGWNVEEDELCPYYVGSNGGKFRSPEEYLYDPQTERVDVFSLGNIFYMLLQKEWPYEDIKTSEAQDMVIRGKGPTIYFDIWNSTDPVNIALKTAMVMCHVTNATERPNSRQVEVYLKSELKRLDPDYEATIASEEHGI